MVTITLTPEQVASVIAQNGTVVVTPSGPTVSPPPPPPEPVIPGFASTKYITIAWGDTSRKYSKDVGGFYQRDCLIIKFTVPANVAVSSGTKNIMGAEWIDNGVPRAACLSLIPGDFSGTSLGLGSMSEGTSFGVNFVIGQRSRYYPGIQPGQTAYLNVKQAYPDDRPDSCNVFVSLSR